MKRLILLLASAIAIPVFGLERFPHHGDRIGVLRIEEHYGLRSEQSVANIVQSDLQGELRELGFNAFDARLTYHDLLRSGPGNADFYVEIVSSRAANRPVGGVAAGTGGIAVEVAIVIARVAAEVRLYDGRSLNLVEAYDLQTNNTAVVPAAIGIGQRSIWAAIMLPFVQYGQYRSAAHAVAHQAALRIAGR